MSIRIGAVDVPKDRKVHLAPTPTLGGIAVVLGVFAGFAVAAAIPELRGGFRFSEVAGLGIGVLITLVLGALDDKRDLGAGAKLAGQVFAAGVLFQFGVRLSYLWLPGVGVLVLSSDLSAIATIVWIVFLMNATNFIDGLDGLCAGLTAISAAALFFYSTQLPLEFVGSNPLAPLVAAAVVGSCIGFLRHNFNPAKIFMGDSGAMPLGFLLAGATISVIGRYAGPPSSVGRVALPLVFMPIIFLALPIADLIFAVIRRVLNGRPIHAPDKEHIHHQLLKFGHSHRQAVVVMYAWATLLAGGLILAGILPSGSFLLAFAIAASTIAVVTLSPKLPYAKRRRDFPPAR